MGQKTVLVGLFNKFLSAIMTLNLGLTAKTIPDLRMTKRSISAVTHDLIGIFSDKNGNWLFFFYLFRHGIFLRFVIYYKVKLTRETPLNKPLTKVMKTKNIHFTDSPAIKGREAKYDVIEIDPRLALKSWKKSLFSFEWLTKDGAIREAEDLPLREHEKRKIVEKRLSEGQSLERPVLGIGLMDNIEIGAGKAVFLTLAAQGHTRIPVHISKADIKEFKAFTAG